jgi:hypothetical protein
MKRIDLIRFFSQDEYLHYEDPVNADLHEASSLD